ncbi:MAG: polyprenyl synthetase family protein [Myxococcales bacterium]|nr:polyprenyl synthetase family protein [Myxococcales bacterium]
MREAAHARVVNAETRVLEPLSTVARSHGLVDVATRLDRIRRWMDADLDDLHDALKAAQADRTDLGRHAARHLLEQPGKRIRPLLVFLTARLGDPVSGEVVRDLAVAAELAHAATLLHDDVIDQGMERRGAPTARLVYGNSASVLGGDHLLIETLRRVERSGHPSLMRTIIDVIGHMVTAEALQLEVRGRFVPDEEVYQRVVAGKTAVLFCWAMRAGATAAGLSPRQIDILDRAGDRLGLAFQLVDDALDLADDPEITGKDTLLDLREGKLTWPLLIACRRDAGLVAQLQGVAAHPELLDDRKFAQDLRHRILQTGCVEATRIRATEAADEARAALAELPASAARDALDTVVEAAVERCR